MQRLRNPVIEVRYNHKKPTHKMRLKSPMGSGMKNPMRVTQRLKNPVR